MIDANKVMANKTQQGCFRFLDNIYLKKIANKMKKLIAKYRLQIDDVK